MRLFLVVQTLIVERQQWRIDVYGLINLRFAFLNLGCLRPSKRRNASAEEVAAAEAICWAVKSRPGHTTFLIDRLHGTSSPLPLPARTRGRPTSRP
jgi:hypothetical protein